MDFTNEFDVAAPVDEVYKTLLDVERVAPCVPGAEVLEKTGDDSYKVAIKVKLGPVSMQYRGDVEVAEKDDASHTATMKVRAKETRGQGNADATSKLALAESNGGTHATITTDVKLSGKAAAMGGRMVGDVSAKMVDTFATNLAAMLEGPPPGDTAETPAVATNGAPSEAAAEPEEETAPTGAAPMGGAEPAAKKEAPPLREAPPAAAQAELNALDLAGSVVAGRLSEPKTLGVVVFVAFALGFLLGRRSG